MQIRAAQQLMRDLYGPRDAARGADATFLWLVEEVGELAQALRGKGAHSQQEEFADVLAWLLSLANVAGVDMQDALLRKYPMACPRCGANPCRCPPA
ncbi:MAG TPA: MazG nucleotide pyrophosphohydrolase domain-containing protein [Candidatus Thermoplasmatota archaeon]|jgi:NTP pyrophosphatase (non-canonical NTP hydrolase)|nr:MazG nucleotide pyrophosphohydrolase domain-containing protein [Candidatus Thermoplasmatota archaeon]